MEFGYTAAPHKSFPVVFDSPRNRGLKDFPYKRILVCGTGQRGGPSGGSVTGPVTTGPYNQSSLILVLSRGRRTQVVGKWGVRGGHWDRICK